MDKLKLNAYQNLCQEDLQYLQEAMDTASSKALGALFCSGLINDGGASFDIETNRVDVWSGSALFAGHYFTFGSMSIAVVSSGYLCLALRAAPSITRRNPATGSMDSLYEAQEPYLLVTTRKTGICLGFVHASKDGTEGLLVYNPDRAVNAIFNTDVLKKLGVLPSPPPRKMVPPEMIWRDKHPRPRKVVGVFLVNG